MIVRHTIVAAFVLASCTSTSPEASVTKTGANTPDPEPQKADAKTPARTTTQTGDGTCDPVPHAGDPCGKRDSFCVLSWGEPGGFSSALWCRDGKWQIEEEVNLDE